MAAPLAPAAALIAGAASALALAAAPVASASHTPVAPDAVPAYPTEEVASFDGKTVWVRGHDVLVRREDRTERLAGVRPMSWLDLGPGPDGETIAVYPRCPSGRCDIVRLDLETGRERKVPIAAKRGAAESLPSVWAGRIAFTRGGRIWEGPLEGRGAARAVGRARSSLLDLELGKGVLVAPAVAFDTGVGNGETKLGLLRLDRPGRRASVVDSGAMGETGTAGFGALTAERDGLWYLRQVQGGCRVRARVAKVVTVRRRPRTRPLASAPLATQAGRVDVPGEPSVADCELD